MIDINLIRNNPKLIKKKIKERGYKVDIGNLIEIDNKWKKKKLESDKLRQKRNIVSIEISKLKKEKKDASKKLKEAKEIPKKLESITRELKELEEKKNSILHEIPNIQDDSVPIGGEEKNKVIEKHGKIPKFSCAISDLSSFNSTITLDSGMNHLLAGASKAKYPIFAPMPKGETR